MMKFELRNDYCSWPANSYFQILRHPSGNLSKSIELAIFNEHRFAFYYWIRWNLNYQTSIIPDLISFDWHQDLAYPSENEQRELNQLSLNNLFEVSCFSWARLNPLNDNHILSATYLNQINDIWVVCKQNRFEEWKDEKLYDRNNRVHIIRKFPDQGSLFKELVKSKIEHLFFDIDLDYFTIENSTSNDKHRFTYMKDRDINDIFNTDDEFMRWIFKRMDGFTIALEPEHVGSIFKTLKYLTLLNKLFFNGSILHWDCEWKHLVY